MKEPYLIHIKEPYLSPHEGALFNPQEGALFNPHEGALFNPHERMSSPWILLLLGNFIKTVLISHHSEGNNYTQKHIPK